MAVGNLAARFLVALVAVPPLLFIFYHSRPELTWALIFGASLLAMREFFAMAFEDPADRAASVIFGAATAGSFYWLSRVRGGDAMTLFIAVVPISLYYLFRFRDLKTAASRLALSVTGALYAGVLLTYLALLKRDHPHGADLIVFVLLVTWVGDTGAYFAGRYAGGRKLYVEISPSKTWAGALGGLAGSSVAAAAVKLTLLTHMSWIDILLLGIPGAALGQLGDLVESLVKRSRGVKDSGTLLPGHGGVLDRVDAVLFMAPYVYLYVTFRPYIAALF